MSRLHRFAISVLSVCALLATAGCQQKVMDTRAQDERAIRDADAAGLQAAQAKDVDRAVANYADNASWLPPHAPLVSGKEGIRAEWSKLISNGGFDISWQIAKLEVARAGDLAYVLYTYQMTLPGADGRLTTDHGKDMAVWKKQPDGAWKIVADTFNSDLPVAAPAKAPEPKHRAAKHGTSKKRKRK